MTTIWAGVIGALLAQEPASTAAALLLARHDGLSIWLVHLIWLGLVIFKIVFGYIVGRAVHQALPRSRLARWGKSLGVRFKRHVPAHSRGLAFGLLGLLTFTWSPAFVAAWLDLPFWGIGVALFAGNLVWYVLEWGVVLGVGAVTGRLMPALILVLAIGLGVGFLINFVRNKTGLMR